ncbi:MAG: DUF5667 domain-containing protein [Sporichthyaceae bacterium]
MTVRPQDLRQARRFAVALESGGGSAGDGSGAALVPLTRLANGIGQSLAPAAPSEDFRLALRSRLLAVGAVGVAPAPALGSPTPWRRRLVAASAVIAISTGGAAATAVASSDALPGDRLYEVKRAVEQVQLALAGSELDRGKKYLTIAATRMAEVQALLARNPQAAADPALVQELRETLSASSAALAEGSERLFAVFGETANAAVLAPLEQFLAERAAVLSDVRRLLPTELLPKQDSLIDELESLAARVATATGRTSPGATPGLAPASASSPLVVDRPTANSRASRAHAKRAPVAAAPALDSTVQDIDRAVAEAKAKADAEAEKAAVEQERRHAKMKRDVRTLVEVDLVGERGSASIGSLDGVPSEQDSVSAGPAYAAPSRPSAGAGAGWMLLNLLPVPDYEMSTSVPGSLSASLDLGSHRTAGKRAQY